MQKDKIFKSWFKSSFVVYKRYSWHARVSPAHVISISQYLALSRRCEIKTIKIRHYNKFVTELHFYSDTTYISNNLFDYKVNGLNLGVYIYQYSIDVCEMWSSRLVLPWERLLVVVNWRFDGLSGGHPHSQVKSVINRATWRMLFTWLWGWPPLRP